MTTDDKTAGAAGATDDKAAQDPQPDPTTGLFPVGTIERDHQMANRAREGRGEKPLTMDEFKTALGIKDEKNENDDKGNKSASGDKKPEDKDAKDAVANAGLDWDDLGKQLKETGDITADAKAALVKTGIPEKVIDDYIAMVKSTQAGNTDDAIAYAGGKEAWDELAGWASKNLTKAEADAANAILATPGWKSAIDTIKAKREAARPTAGEPRLETPAGGRGDTRVSGYRSRAAQAKDMQDPRYRTSPEFREEVALKTRYATWDLDKAPQGYVA